jgi:hypothetical protein
VLRSSDGTIRNLDPQISRAALAPVIDLFGGTITGVTVDGNDTVERDGNGNPVTALGALTLDFADGARLTVPSVPCPVTPGKSTTATTGQTAAPVSAVDPDDRSDHRYPERPVGPLARSRPAPVSTKRRRELASELGAHAAGLVQQAGADHERPAANSAVTEATAGMPLQIMCPRRSPEPAAVTEKTPRNGLEITAGLCAVI